MAMVRTAMAHAGGRSTTGAERYMVHVVADSCGQWAEHLDGTPLPFRLATRIACDASMVGHLRGPGSQPLSVGRRTRTWNRAQRRAIAVRDAGHCRYPECRNRVCDIHHLRPWDEGGPTDITNGILLCTRHHTLLHEGLSVSGDANGPTTFRRPDGAAVGTTAPSPRGPRRV